ncbi:MAG: acetylornithine transaminase [Actinobacteria bacterium]|jgi:acetylornithine aminotransferase|nr:acetylornithine transaminase [Actinomycetota bacterium]
MRKKVKTIALSTRWNSVMQSTYGTPSVELVKGSGIEVWDSSGKKYLDFLGGIATNLLGHNHPQVSAAISKQAKTLSHISNFYAHEPGLVLAEKLQAMVADSSARVFFCNSGAEAIEAALKMSRLTGKKKIVAAQGAFHGRTMGALSLTGQPAKRNPFKPLLKGIKHVPYGDTKALIRSVNSRTAMVILEPMMGEAGVVVPPSGYLAAARDVCNRYGALLVFDCVQTGMGRTGQWFGYEHENIKPDIITIAKGLGGGLPLGAVISVGKSASLFTPGSHGTTFGGNPISCAAANAVIDEIESKKMLALNASKGALIRNLISPIRGVKEARGRGLLIGIVVENGKAKEIAARLLELGFLVNATNDDVVRIAPAFVVSQKQIMSFVRAFADACEEVFGG